MPRNPENQAKSPLQEARIAADMTQFELAAAAGVSIGTISDIETTGRVPTPRIALKLARALGFETRIAQLFPEPEPQEASA